MEKILCKLSWPILENVGRQWWRWKPPQHHMWIHTRRCRRQSNQRLDLPISSASLLPPIYHSLCTVQSPWQLTARNTTIIPTNTDTNAFMFIIYIVTYFVLSIPQTPFNFRHPGYTIHRIFQEHNIWKHGGLYFHIIRLLSFSHFKYRQSTYWHLNIWLKPFPLLPIF